MKRREQADLFLRKAAQDEAVLDLILTSDRVSDEIVGFHCQQAAEKLLKALLSDLGIPFKRTHDIGGLTDLLAKSGTALPHEFSELDTLTPFGAVYRYEDYDAGSTIERDQVRRMIANLREWVERRIQD